MIRHNNAPVGLRLVDQVSDHKATTRKNSQPYTHQEIVNGVCNRRIGPDQSTDMVDNSVEELGVRGPSAGGSLTFL